MSEISSKLSRLQKRSIQLNAHVLSYSLFGYFMGDWSKLKTIQMLNEHIISNEGEALTDQGVKDIESFLEKFASQRGSGRKILYIKKIHYYSIALHNGSITETEYDRMMGIGSTV